MFTGSQAVREQFARFRKDERGALVVIAALALPVLLGFAALGVDVASWYVNERTIQSAADASAVSAALESLHTDDIARISRAAKRDAVRNGVREDAGDTITVNVPPQSGAFAGNNDAAEVVVRRTAPLFFGRVLGGDGPIVAGRAVALTGFGGSRSFCIWVLDPALRASLKVSGGAEVVLDCGIFVNSSDASALQQSGTGSCLTASRIKIVGGYTGECVQPEPVVRAQQIPDPLAGMPAPSFGNCGVTKKVKVSGGETLTLQPGVYCGAIEVLASGRLIFAPGTYVLDGAGLKLAAGSQVSGEGVFFYLTSKSGPSDAISINGGASVTLSAPAAGEEYAGVLFFQDRAAAANVTHSLTGGSTMRMAGILYFPNQSIRFSGGTDVDFSSSLIVVNSLSFTGHSHVGNLEESVVAENRYLARAMLVE